MAKIYKVEGYIIAASENRDEAIGEVKIELERVADRISYPSWWPYLRIQQAEIENFTDDLPLNFGDVSLGALDKYFVHDFLTKRFNVKTEE